MFALIRSFPHLQILPTKEGRTEGSPPNQVISVQVAHSVTDSLSAYCLGRVLASRFGYEFAFPQLRNLVRDWKTGGARFIGAEVAWRGQWPFEWHSGRKVREEELMVKPEARLLLVGGFHRFDLFQKEREQIQQRWLAPVYGATRRNEGQLAIGLSAPAVKARVDGPSEWNSEDDGPPEGNCLSEEEIRKLARTVKHSELVLISDRGDHPLFPALADLSPSIIVCRGWSQLLLVRSFEKIAFSQDVTQWWGAFLSDAAEVYFPPLDRGPWSHPEPAHLGHEPWWHGIDLKVSDDPRYIYDW